MVFASSFYIAWSRTCGNTYLADEFRCLCLFKFTECEDASNLVQFQNLIAIGPILVSPVEDFLETSLSVNKTDGCWWADTLEPLVTAVNLQC